MDLTDVGAWVPPRQLAEATDTARQLERLGFGAIWVPGGGTTAVFDVVEGVLDATNRVVVATGIANIWTRSARRLADWHHTVIDRHPDRFLLGLGVSHAPLVDKKGLGQYGRPLATMRSYLDQLDGAPAPIPPSQRALAALGPRMLALGRDRARGVHPYLVTPEHTAWAREVVGTAMLAPEQTVILESDPRRARQHGRAFLRTYLELPNYVRSWLREGFDEQDVAGTGSDRLVDALVAWGDADRIADRVRSHLDAGADHICLQVVPTEGQPMSQVWPALASAMALDMPES